MNVYEIVTSQIIEKLEAGVIPWQKPWLGYRNGVSKKQYRGMNILLLAGTGYSSVDFFTAKQINKLGGKIIKGSKGHIITFWKMFLKADENGQPIYDSNGKQKKSFMLRYYKVFNREQCEGLPEYVEADGAQHDLEPIDACEALISGYVNAPQIITEGAQALYSATFDVVRMPALKTFTSIEGYYSTLFHELTHSTGHISRLGRLEKCNYGLNSDRSREELTAEIGASFLCGMAGIDNETIDNSASYIESWLKVFKGDHKFLIQSATSAQKAIDHITGAVFEESKPQPKKKKGKKEIVMT